MRFSLLYGGAPVPPNGDPPPSGRSTRSSGVPGSADLPTSQNHRGGSSPGCTCTCPQVPGGGGKGQDEGRARCARLHRAPGTELRGTSPSRASSRKTENKPRLRAGTPPRTDWQVFREGRRRPRMGKKSNLLLGTKAQDTRPFGAAAARDSRGRGCRSPPDNLDLPPGAR